MPATRAYFISKVRAGASVRETAAVTNRGHSVLHLRLTGVDGLTGVTSGVVYGSRRSAGGPSSWLRLPRSGLTVPARSVALVHFTVHVPRGTTPGDHLAGVSFQTPAPKRSGHGVVVHVVVRTVIGVELIVRGPAAPRLHLSGVALAQLPGTADPAAMVTLGDTGRLLCKPRLSVTIRGGGGRTASESLATLLPRDTIRFPFRWPGRLGRGRYRVTARATGCGPATSVTAVSVYPPAAAHHRDSSGLGPLAGFASKDGGGWWPLAAIGAALLVAGAWLTRLRGRWHLTRHGHLDSHAKH